MRHDEQVKLLRRFFEARQARTTDMAERIYRNPASVYTDPDRFAAEWERLFRPGPVVVGLSGDLPAVGDYFTTEAAGVPVLLVRGEDGELRAFLNACRHRGGRVAEGRGRPGRTFTCPYHAWCYDIHGRLVGQPLAQDAFDELDRDATGLIPLPAAEHAGLLLVRPGGGPPVDAEAELAGLDLDLADHHFEDHRFFTEVSDSFAMNWKLAIDTFLEAYHIFSLHRATIAPEFLSTPSLHDAFGPHGRLLAFRRSALDLADTDEDTWSLRRHCAVVYRLMPATILNLVASGQTELWEFHPDGPDRTRVAIKFYSPGEVGSEKERDHWDRNVEFTTGVVFVEDFPQQERIHVNLRTGLLPELIFGRNEPGLIHFHQALAAALNTR